MPSLPSTMKLYLQYKVLDKKIDVRTCIASHRLLTFIFSSSTLARLSGDFLDCFDVKSNADVRSKTTCTV